MIQTSCLWMSLKQGLVGHCAAPLHRRCVKAQFKNDQNSFITLCSQGRAARFARHHAIFYVTAHYIYIYIYAFSRRFYSKRLTVNTGYTFIVSMCVPWKLNPQPFAQLTQWSTTEPQEHIRMRSSFQFRSSIRSSVYMSSHSDYKRNKPPLTIRSKF